jgi:acyl-CoA oxidase
LVNRLGANVGLSHAGISAEGDNVVLMQKVAKELLGAVQGGKHVLEGDDTRKAWNVGRLEDCVELVGKVREKILVKQVTCSFLSFEPSGKVLTLTHLSSWPRRWKFE